MNRISSLGNECPWSGIKWFIRNHKDIFTKDSMTRFVIGVLNNEDKLDRIVTADFKTPENSDEVRIYGESTKHGIKNYFALYPEQETGIVSAPELKCKVEIVGKQRFYLIDDPYSSDAFDPVMDEQLKICWKVISHIIDGTDDAIQKALDKITYIKKS